MWHTAQWHNATLTHNQLSEQTALEHSLALRVDRRKLCRERRLEIRNELPAHFFELAFPVNESKDNRVLRWAQVVNGFEIEHV